jgi:hypothetical protein
LWIAPSQEAKPKPKKRFSAPRRTTHTPSAPEKQTPSARSSRATSAPAPEPTATAAKARTKNLASRANDDEEQVESSHDLADSTNGLAEELSASQTEPAPKKSKSKKHKQKKSEADEDNGSSKLVKVNKRKKSKDEPKKPKNAYQLWCAEARMQPQFASFGFVEMNKALSAAWAEVDDQGKAPFKAEASKAKKEYEREMKELRRAASSSDQGPKSGAVQKKKLQKKAHNSSSNARKSSKRAAIEADDGHGTDDLASGMSRELLACSKVPSPEKLPILTEDEYEERPLKPMRVDTIKKGMEIAWIPQAFVEFMKAHGKVVGQALGEQAAELLAKVGTHPPAKQRPHVAPSAAYMSASLLTYLFQHDQPAAK